MSWHGAHWRCGAGSCGGASRAGCKTAPQYGGLHLTNKGVTAAGGLWEDGGFPLMKIPTALLFAFTLLAAAVTASAGAETRLIPFDEFFLSVPLEDVTAAAGGIQVSVRVSRGVQEPLGSTKVEVSCPVLAFPERSLDAEEVAVFLEACAAASRGEVFRQEVRRGINKTVYESALMEGGWRVRMRRGGEVLFAPQEAARLKASLAQAAAAEAWYRELLTAGTLPEKTAAAHPPKAAGFFLISKLGGVRAEGLEYEVTLRKFPFKGAQKYSVTHGLRYFALGGSQTSMSGAWVKRLLEQVALALQAVGRKEAFAYVSPQNGRDNKFTVTANLETQQADVTFDAGGYTGKHSPVQGSFGVKQLAEIRAIAAQGPAREKWFAEHESWFFEKE